MAHLLIAGAGAAGLFAAGEALATGHRVTLVEHMDAPGKKLAITGKGRCNVTNDCDVDVFLKNVRTNPRFLYSAVSALPPAAVMALFSTEMGVPLKTERGRRVFPQSDAAQDIIDALVRRARAATLVKGRVVRLLIEDGRATGAVLQDGRNIAADAVLVATGGVSYPVTGSTGIGYELAKQAGHHVVPPQPSLVSIKVPGGECAKMAGLSLKNVNVSLLENGKVLFSELGEMLFTHFGVSGPVVLSASAYLGDLAKKKYEISIDLKPALDETKLDARLQRDFVELANRDAANGLDKLLPQSMRAVALARWGVNPATKVNQLTREDRRRLGGLVKDFRLAVGARGDLTHAVITSGGVDVREVNPKTMESKRLPGLYFAGEVLDVDAYTGGYNLQIAWSTAYAAAQGIFD